MSLSPDQLSQLRQCLKLACDPNRQSVATTIFSQLRRAVSQDAATQSLIDLLWNEVLASRRSSAFWEQLSDAEKDMSEQLAQSHFQLQQSYLRLMQEQ